MLHKAGTGSRGEGCVVAVTAQPMDTRLILTFYLGDDQDGQPIEKTKSFNNVKTSAQDEDLYEVAQALSGLQTYDLVSTERVDREALIETEV